LVTLNRPKALNALSLEMIRGLHRQLDDWGERAFSAGGDVRSIWDAGNQREAFGARFFREEYRLNRAVKVFPKPYIAFIDGVVMGGGAGISLHGDYRIVTERSLFAMPETGIGLFPDVGTSFVLSRLPGCLGLYLALTGARLKAADCLYCGLADAYLTSARLPALEDALAAADQPLEAARAVVAAATAAPGPPPLAARREAIDRCFAGESVEEILAALEREADEWGPETAELLRRRSPTSLKVTFEELRRARELDFDRALTMEYRLSQGCVAGHDFFEGVRAVVIEKDGRPDWRPARLDEVTPELVARHFARPAAGDLTFGDE
jgi:enoyl-CoA hydratase